MKSPNPEEHEAFTLAIKLAQEVEADIIIGTDPDCDRMGAVVRNNEGEYIVLTGNQSGAIMVHYLLSTLKERGQLPANGVVIKTIVTSEMGADIARSYGAEVVNTLTGFKYIGEKITQYEKTGEHSILVRLRRKLRLFDRHLCSRQRCRYRFAAHLRSGSLL